MPADVGLGAFCGAPLDRATGAEQKDPQWEKTALGCDNTRFLLFSTRKGSTRAAPVLLKQKPFPPAIAWQTVEALKRLGVDLDSDPSFRCEGVPPVLLGARDGAQHYALLVDIGEEDLVKSCEVPEGKTLFVSDGMGMLLKIGCDEQDFTTLGQAFAKITWHKRTLYDGSSGEPTEPIECGLKRQTPPSPGASSGGARAYPRTDAVAIALVRHPSDDKCLLIASKAIPGMWTCVSGFVEPGEQVEEAFRREVWEETGVVVDLTKGVDWIGSQPWPLGPGGACQLMLGAEVQASSTEVKPDTSEVAGAEWFSRAEIQEMLVTQVGNKEGKAAVPGKIAIAHHMLQRWLDRSK